MCLFCFITDQAVLDQEQVGRADISRAGNAAAEGFQDAVILADGSVLGRTQNDVHQVVPTLHDLVRRRNTTWVHRETEPVNEFKQMPDCCMGCSLHCSCWVLE